MDRKLLLLGLLRRQEMHGYQLYEFIERDLAVCTDLKKPTAYYLLNKMAADGWIAEELEQEGNRPPRRVYRITPAGEEQFQSALRENIAAHEPVYFSGDMGLAFLDDLPPEEALDCLRQRREALSEALGATHATPRHPGSMQLVLDHRLHHQRAELDWLDGLLAALMEKYKDQG